MKAALLACLWFAATGPSGQMPPKPDVKVSTSRTVGVLKLGSVLGGTLQAPNNVPQTVRYSLRLSSRSSVEINLVSSDFDPLLEVFDSPTATEFVLSDDDSGGDTNAKLTLVNQGPDSKTYFLDVTSFEDRGGAFRISALPIEFVPPSSAVLLPWEGEASGMIGPQSPIGGKANKRYAEFRLEVPRESLVDKVALIMESVGFDPQMEVLRGNGIIAENDDSGEGNNPLAIVSVTAGEILTVRLLADADKANPFKVRAVPITKPRAAHPTIMPIILGTPREVIFAADEPVLDNVFRPYALFRYTGKSGERIVLTATRREKGDAMEVRVGGDTAAGFATLPSSRLLLGRNLPFRSPTVRLIRDGDVDFMVIGPVLFKGVFTVSLTPAPPSVAPQAN